MRKRRPLPAMGEPTPLDILFVEALRLTFKGPRATPSDLAALERAARDAHLSGLTDSVSCLLHWAADVHAKTSTDESLAALHAAARLQAQIFSQDAEPDTPEADPDYWWQKGQMA